MESEYHVTGMTCGHCVQAVTGEISGIAGVSAVEVDLATGRVLVTSDGPLRPEDVSEAVVEAGYQLAV